MTLIEVIDVARDIINEPLDASRSFPDNSSSFWKDSTLIRYVNLVQQEVQQTLVQSFEDYFLTQTSVNIVNGTTEYALPSDFLKMRRVEDVRGSGTPVEIRPISLNDKDSFSTPFLGSSTIFGRGYYIAGTQLVFDDTPTFTTTSAIKLHYIHRVADISAATSVSSIPVEYHQVLVWGVASLALMQQQSDNNTAQREFEKRLQRMKIESEDRQVQRPRSVKKKAYRTIIKKGYV